MLVVGWEDESTNSERVGGDSEEADGESYHTSSVLLFVRRRTAASAAPPAARMGSLAGSWIVAMVVTAATTAAIREVVVLSMGRRPATKPCALLVPSSRRSECHELYSSRCSPGCPNRSHLKHPELDVSESRWLGISPEGIGPPGMVLTRRTRTVSRLTREPPLQVRVLVDLIRVLWGARQAHEIDA